MTENGESATGQTLLELAAADARAGHHAAAAWRHQRRLVQRIGRLLEPLEPVAQRRVLVAVALLYGHEALAGELRHVIAWCEELKR